VHLSLLAVERGLLSRASAGARGALAVALPRGAPQQRTDGLALHVSRASRRSDSEHDHHRSAGGRLELLAGRSAHVRSPVPGALDAAALERARDLRTSWTICRV